MDPSPEKIHVAQDCGNATVDFKVGSVSGMSKKLFESKSPGALRLACRRKAALQREMFLRGRKGDFV